LALLISANKKVDLTSRKREAALVQKARIWTHVVTPLGRQGLVHFLPVPFVWWNGRMQRLSSNVELIATASS
jgi:hypothetical protein